MEAVSQRFLILIGAILSLKLALLVLLFADWGYGVLRGFLLFLALALLAVLWFVKPQQPSAADNALVSSSLKWLLVSAFAIVMAGVASIAITVRLGDGYFDMSANMYRSAQYLLRGESPYAAGMLLDPGAYMQRAGIRKSAGIGAIFPDDQVMDKADDFWRSLDPDLRRKLLPAPINDDPIAAREYSVLGYKYGPVPLLVVAALIPVMGAASAPFAIVLCTILWAVLIGAIMLRAGWNRPWAVGAACLVLIEPHVAVAVLYHSSVDVWPMVFGALAVLAVMTQRPLLLGAAVALAVGSKIFPGVVYLPLLLMVRPLRSISTFVAILAAIHLPWLIWDARGFYYNVVLWPTLMLPDTTSWVVYAGKDIALLVRLALLSAIAGVSLWLVIYGGTRRLFWSLALLNLAVVCAGSGIHNNYMPWFSGWFVLAIITCLMTAREEDATPISASPSGAEATASAPGKS